MPSRSGASEIHPSASAASDPRNTRSTPCQRTHAFVPEPPRPDDPVALRANNP
jgi:hypothetical protein